MRNAYKNKRDEPNHVVARQASEEDSPDRMPIQVYGSDYLPLHQEHIDDAMNNPLVWTGEQRHASPSILTCKGSRHHMSWIPLSCNSGFVRGEYPYASTNEGGYENRHQVSLRCLPQIESWDQGGFNSTFYRGAQIGINDAFLVIPEG